MTNLNHNHTNFFAEIKGSSQIIYDYFINHIQNVENLEWINIFEFDAIPLEREIWIRESILNLVNEKFPIFGCAILRVNSNSIYDWHVDEERGVCINMLLSFDHVSKCFFRENGEIITLDYKKHKFYLFNNQKLHMVENFEKPRYIFSTKFVDNKHKLNYKTVYDWMIENKLILN